ncbi:SGNH/GDSL hydrolase family protein [Streptomyces sp. NPDC058657]|uniref:SGNH/GDSL hydrolase family protein n=1 Tax=unclassified Streptomyces TaxID=2593676 RepID=UPI003649778A
MTRLRYAAAVAVLTLLWTTGCTEAPDVSAYDPPGPGAVAAARPEPPQPSASDSDSAKDAAGVTKEPRTGPADPTRKTPKARPRPRQKYPVLYLGDSLAMESQRVLGKRLGDTGRATVHSAPYSGTTLCDYLSGRAVDSLVPPQDKAAALVTTHRPRVVVLQFWGNAWGYTPCMDNIPQGSAPYYERYAKDADTLTAQIAAAARSAGIPRPRIVWVLQGPDAFSADRTRRVNDLYRAQASATGDSVSDAGRAVSGEAGRYVWQQRLPCTGEERARAGDCRNGLAEMHRDDDPLHFCQAPTTSKPQPCPVHSPGIARYTKAITATVDAYLRRAD